MDLQQRPWWSEVRPGEASALPGGRAAWLAVLPRAVPRPASRDGLPQGCRKAPAVHVDHRHGTGRVRGVRCFNCNSAIGTLGDDPDTVRRANSYLEGTRGSQHS
ncbi:endonuclease domain-containing protein [Streptomyces sp. NPDC090025]|uniref:endonuclease domain-containing protein n=1 Tax=Streptomyces sp. NPDC090025 TaxID=3365922 RepID=UPI003833DD41